MQTIVSQMKDYCNLHNICEKDFANLMQVSEKQVKRWFTGHAMPNKTKTSIFLSFVGTVYSLEEEPFSIRCRFLRIEMKLSLPKFAKMMNVSRSTVINWEAGKSLPNVTNIEIFERLERKVYDES